MLVTNRFQTSKYLEELPSDFKVIKVELNSLKDNTLRRLCRDLEKQTKKDPVKLDEDRLFLETYLKEILEREYFDTTDISSTLIVLGNKQGLLTSKIFNMANYEKFLIDHNQFSDTYPIFIDTSVIKHLDSGKETLKRERAEETFTHDPEAKRDKFENFADIQAVWKDQEDEFMSEINHLKAKYDTAMEQNQEILQAAQDNEQELKRKVIELQQALEITNMIVEEEEETSKIEEINALQEANTFLRKQVEEMSNQPPNNPEKLDSIKKFEPKAQVAGVFDTLMQSINEGHTEQAEQLVKTLEDQKHQLQQKLTLSQIGMQPWNDRTTSFLDFMVSFNVAAANMKIEDVKCIQLLFSALPAKYSYVRTVISALPVDITKSKYIQARTWLIKLIVGGKEKIFHEFLNLQRKKEENYLMFYQKLVDYYLFSKDSGIKFSDLENDSTAFKMIKEKMIAAYPNRYLPEFKRRLEGKSKLNDIFTAVLDMRENFPDTEENDREQWNGMGLNVLKQKNKDWQKNVKCFKCGIRGHIKRDCYKRETKTKKSGISRRNDRR